MSQQPDPWRWIIWRSQPSATRPGKTDKLPLDYRTGAVGNAQDPALWLGSRELAQAWAASWAADGVGIVLAEGAGQWAVDLDDCLLPDGTWSAEAQRLCGLLTGCYVDISPSGRGLRIIGRGRLPPHGCRRTDAEGRSCELYSSGRFVTVTGTSAMGGVDYEPPAEVLATLASMWPPAEGTGDSSSNWRDGPVPEWSGPTDDAELVGRLLAMPQSAGAAFGGRASFAALWEGDEFALGRVWPDAGGRPYDCSRADSALAAHLAWATGNDCPRIERLMRMSALVRDKWDARPDYLQRTISRETGRCTRWMGGSHLASTPTAADAPEATQGRPTGMMPATLMDVVDALAGAGQPPRYDEFLGAVLYEGRPVTDDDLRALRVRLQRHGYKPISSDTMRDAVAHVAHLNRYDSAIEWAQGLRWDGVPRIATFAERYLGCDRTDYAQAVGLYLWTALAGRLMQPGCQADMALILVGAQGAGKTSLVRALVPTPEAAGELDLNKIDQDDTCRKLRGKLVVELAELKGLRGRDAESIKAYITRAVEEWIEKWQTYPTRYARRCVFVGTTNETELLDDPTGNRRWLPIQVGAVDVGAITRDRDQLWAEGLTMWSQGGIAWREAETLARAEHEQYRVVDEWEAPLVAWLGANPAPEGGHVMADIARQALGIGAAQLGRREQLRIAVIMRGLGWGKSHTRDGKRWARR